MLIPDGPTLRELATQALSSTEHGYDLLAPTFDRTPFRTPDAILDAVEHALHPLGPYAAGLDLCCGTGAGTGLLRRLGTERVVGVDFSAGMLAVARATFAPGQPERTQPARPDPEHTEPERPERAVHLVRGDARALPFVDAFDLVTSFGAFGHFLPEERPTLFGRVHAALRPGGLFAFPVTAPAWVGSPLYWALWGFDLVMRVRNALWRPRFVMYYRTFRPHRVLAELTTAGFAVTTRSLPELGWRPDGSPNCRLVLARKA